MTAKPHAADDRHHLAPIGAGSRLLPWAISPLDVAVYTVIIGIGVLEFFLSQTSDFSFDDVAYLERGLSLLHNHFYGFGGIPERVQPPGLPFIIAVISALIGHSHVVLLRAMAIFGTLGLLATYEFLRREERREIAAAVCLLLGSTPQYFKMATRELWPSYPYMLAAMLMLLAAWKADAARARQSGLPWALLTALLLAAALMMHSSGIALIGGLCAWVGTSFVVDRPNALRRLKTFLPVLLVGVAAQAWWMHHAPLTSDWPIPGYPASYLSQVQLKSGNFPELGMASLGDLVTRGISNTQYYAGILTGVIFHHHSGIKPAWPSLAITGMIVLILLGVGYSLWRTGGRLMDWYFISYAAMYLLWPWTPEFRFILAATPLAAVYAWCGAQAIRRLAIVQPRLTGAAGLLVSGLLGIYSILWALGLGAAGRLPGGLQAKISALGWLHPIISALGWLIIALASAWMLWSGRPPFVIRPPALSNEWLPRGRARMLGVILVLPLVVVGLAQQAALGWQNTHEPIDVVDKEADVAGAKWIEAHTPPDVVVLARQVPIVYYYAQRRVYWFPPISRPAVLFEGIRQRKVNYVLVVKRENPYYLPDDPDCFAPLLMAYPGAFRLAARGSSYSVFEVLP